MKFRELAMKQYTSMLLSPRACLLSPRAESRGYRLLYVQIKVSPDNHRDPLDLTYPDCARLNNNDVYLVN